MAGGRSKIRRGGWQAAGGCAVARSARVQYMGGMADEPDQPRVIAFIGLGVMGSSMAGHLLSAGHSLRVHSRTKTRAAGLIARGAAWADSPADAARGADMAISIVGYPDDVRTVHLGERGTLEGLASEGGSVIVDMTTSQPSLAREIHEAAAARGVGAVDAPVSGGDVGARNATLSIMVGGAPDAVESVMPVLTCLGRNIEHQGGPGAGQHTKMVNQILIAGTMMGVCEGLAYARAAGLDGGKVIASVGAGAAGSWSINTLGPRILKGDFGPGFYVEHFIKDLGIALEEAERMGLRLPGLELAKKLYDELAAMGGSREGTQALMRVVEGISQSTRAGPP